MEGAGQWDRIRIFGVRLPLVGAIKRQGLAKRVSNDAMMCGRDLTWRKLISVIPTADCAVAAHYQNLVATRSTGQCPTLFDTFFLYMSSYGRFLSYRS